MGGMGQPDRRDAGAPAWAPLDRPGAPGPPAYPPRPPVQALPPRPVPARVAAQVPSGLFPGSAPRRPVYREPLPIGPSGVTLGIVAGALWMTLFGLLAHNARQYAWATIVATLLAWPVLAVLARSGDRGVAAGGAATVGLGLAAAGVLVMVRWIAGDWLLW